MSKKVNYNDLLLVNYSQYYTHIFNYNVINHSMYFLIQ